MSRRQEVQSGDGIIQNFPGQGYINVAKTSAPAGGEVGYAPGCLWIVVGGTTSQFYINIGNNGVGTNATATWIEADPTSAQKVQMGTALTSSGWLAPSGNLYRTILTVANTIKASATGLLKIVDIYTLPANSFSTGNGLQFTAWFNNGGTSGNTVRAQIVANPSNSGLPASGAGVAGQTDGTVTVTGGTVILDTGATFAPTGTVTFGISIQGQIFKTGAKNSNTQESILTSVLPQAGLTHTSKWTDQVLTENAANVFALCISAATSTNDIQYQGMEITGFN